MFKTFLVLTLLINLLYVKCFNEPDDYSDYQESVPNDVPPAILEGFEEAPNNTVMSLDQPEISEKNGTTKNQLTLDDWLQENLPQWLQANLLATILIGVAFGLLTGLIVCICTIRNVRNVQRDSFEMVEPNFLI